MHEPTPTRPDTTPTCLVAREFPGGLASQVLPHLLDAALEQVRSEAAAEASGAAEPLVVEAPLYGTGPEAVCMYDEVRGGTLVLVDADLSPMAKLAAALEAIQTHCTVTAQAATR